jgi:putative membrane protein
MLDGITGWLAPAYLWIQAGHVVAVVAWMAALFYLPRLFVYHAERGPPGSELDATFRVMERRLLRPS